MAERLQNSAIMQRPRNVNHILLNCAITAVKTTAFQLKNIGHLMPQSIYAFIDRSKTAHLIIEPMCKHPLCQIWYGGLKMKIVNNFETMRDTELTCIELWAPKIDFKNLSFQDFCKPKMSRVVDLGFYFILCN